MTTLEDLLHNVFLCGQDFHDTESDGSIEKETAQSIRELVLDKVIGENEPEHQSWANIERNQLRTQQRKALSDISKELKEL